MKKQVIFIHGGDIFKTYKEYLSYLKNYEISKKSLARKKWHSELNKKLGKDFEIIMPEMPNKRNARYIEWKIWFEHYLPLLENNVILIGSSLGGTFLIKYLLENKFPKKIKGIFFAAAPFGDREKYFLADFHFNPKNLKNLEKICSQIYFYHSKDDSYVTFADFEKYKKYLPSANFHEFADRGHFRVEKFPEIIRDIKKLK